MQISEFRKKRPVPGARVELGINAQDPEPPSRDSLCLWINTSLQIEFEHAARNKPGQLTNTHHTNNAYWVSVYIVDEPEAKQYNLAHRKKPYATNVLSFSHDLPQVAHETFLGDILACAPVIRHEALEQKKPLEQHWAHMIVHSTLHLLGYDHQNAQDANHMEALEIQVLSKLNIPNPYETTSRAIEYE